MHQFFDLSEAHPIGYMTYFNSNFLSDFYAIRRRNYTSDEKLEGYSIGFSTSWKHILSNIQPKWIAICCAFIFNMKTQLCFWWEVGEIAISNSTSTKWTLWRLSNFHEEYLVENMTYVNWSYRRLTNNLEENFIEFLTSMRKITHSKCNHWVSELRQGFCIVRKNPKFNQRLKKENIVEFQTSICWKSYV